MIESTILLEDAKRLADRFQASDLYKNYQHHKNALEKDPLLQERVTTYKRYRYDLERKRLDEGYVSFEEEKRVAHQYTELSLHPLAGPFLACEFELLNLYRQTLDVICEAYDKVL